MSSLLAKLKAGKDNVKVVKFPGTDQDVAIQVLTNGEKQRGALETERYFEAEKIKISATGLKVYNDELNTRLLFQALRDPDDHERSFAGSVGELRDMLTTDEKDLLLEEYDALETEVSPTEEAMTDEALEEFLATVKKNPTVLNASSLPMLRRLSVFMAARLRN